MFELARRKYEQSVVSLCRRETSFRAVCRFCVVRFIRFRILAFRKNFRAGIHFSFNQIKLCFRCSEFRASVGIFQRFVSLLIQWWLAWTKRRFSEQMEILKHVFYVNGKWLSFFFMFHYRSMVNGSGKLIYFNVILIRCFFRRFLFFRKKSSICFFPFFLSNT